MAGSVIKVGMDVGDVKSAGQALLKQLNSQVDATIELAEAQVKYNKEGAQVGSVLKGMTEAGDKYTLVIKQTAAGYELVNAQVLKAKTSFNEQARAQREAAAAAKEDAKAQEQAAAALAKRVEALNRAGARGVAQEDNQSRRDEATGPARFDGGRGGNGSGGFFFSQPNPPIPPGGGAGIDELAKKTEVARAAGERLFITWQGIVRLIEAQIIKRVISEISNALTTAVDDAKRFSIAIAEIRTISQDMPLSVERWRTEITKLSSAFGQTQKDVANAAYETLSNQVAKGADTFVFLESALKFGAATVSSTTDSVNLLSSALKSFNLPAQDTERVAAILFKTIDLGRVRARDMADTLGRVGSIASQVGIKLEEVGAAIAVVTRKGVKPAEAMTLISNVITALIKPTDEMTKLFQQWGVTSGEAAIATFTFEGVLKKLSDEASKGSGRIAELFPNVRGLKGAFQLAGQGASEFQADLKKITNAQKEYNAAAKEVLDSPGKQLEIAGQKIKNLFTEDFGKGVVQGLVDFNKWAETAAGKADGLERSVKLVIKAMTAGLVILVGWKVAMIANAAAGIGWSVVLQKLTYDAVMLGRALMAAAPYLALFAIGYATGEAIQSGNDSGRTAGQIQADLRAKQEERAAEARKRIEENGDPETDKTRKIKTDLDSRYAFLLNYSTNAVKLGNDLKQRTIDQYKDITDVVKISSRTYFDSIIQKMNELKKVASEAENLIKQSLKQSQDIPRRLGNELTNVRLRYASEGRLEYPNGTPTVVDNQKLEILQNQLTETLARARAKAREGTKEAFEESRKLYDDAAKLMAQLFEAQTAQERRVFDEKVQRGMIQPTRMLFDPRTGELRAQYEFVAKTGELEKQLFDLGKERLAQERQFRDLQRQRADTAKQEVDREKERLRSLQQAFAAIERIEVFDKQGKVKEEYKNDPQRAAREFDEQAARIRALAGNEQFGTQYTVFQDLQKQRLALVQQVEAAIRAERAASVQQDLINNRAGTQRLIDGAATQLAAGRQQMVRGMEQLERDLAVVEERTLRPQLARHGRIPGTDLEITSGGDNMLRRWARQAGINTGQSGFDRAEPDRQAAIQALAAVREAQTAFNADRTAAKLDILKQKLEELRAAARKYIQTFTGQNPDNIAEEGDPTRTQGQRLRGLDVGVQDSQGGLAQAAAANAQLERARTSIEALDRRIRTLPGGVEFFAQGLQANTPAINDSFASFTANALTLTNQIRDLNGQLTTAARLLPQIRGNRGGDGNNPDVPQRKFGGPIGPHTPKYFAFGGPVGTDRVPAWLSDDEFVMTGAATRAFAPLLKQMNAYPSRAGGSGSSTTNVGDINITVNGGNTSAHTINEIGVGLRRAIARGTVKLHG